MTPKLKALFSVMLLLAGLVVGLVIAETTLRIVDPRFFSPSLNQFHPTLGWRGRPNQVVYRKSGSGAVRVETNVDGFRDLNHATQPSVYMGKNDSRPLSGVLPCWAIRSRTHRKYICRRPTGHGSSMN